MQKKLERFNDIWKRVSIPLLVLWMCGMLLMFVLDRLLPPADEISFIPEITVKNMGACLGSNQVRVEKIAAGETQWICADVKTDEAQDLYLRIYENETKNEVYVDKIRLSSGTMVYRLNPLLLPGKYLATIRRVRSVIATVEFEVVGK